MFPITQLDFEFRRPHTVWFLLVGSGLPQTQLSNKMSGIPKFVVWIGGLDSDVKRFL